MSSSRLSAAVPLIVACGFFMENLDSTVIATALPQIALTLGEQPAHLSMAMTAYMLALASFLPVSGWAADRFGVRTVFATAIGIFTVSSVLCGLSSGMWELVAARVLQGLGGAMMVPVGRLAILKTVSKDNLVKAMSLVTTPALVGPTVGPLVGGFIATYWSWRWIFFINVPIGLIGIIATLRYIPNIREEAPERLDVRGTIIAGLALLCCVFGLENVGRGLLPAGAIAAMLCMALVMAALYIRHARVTEHPALDLTLFRNVPFAVSISAGTLFRIGIGAFPFLMPLMLQVGFGMSAIESGSLTFIVAIGALSMKMFAPIILRRTGFRRLMIGNAVLSGLLLASCGLFRPSTPHLVIIVGLLAGGFFRSLQFTSLNTLAFAEIPRHLSSRASTLSSVMQQLSLSLGVASGASVLMFTTILSGVPTPRPEDFTPAFALVGLAAMASSLAILRLSPDAGAEVSGHRRAEVPASSATEAET